MAGIGAMGDLARVNTNVGALNAYNHLRSKSKAIQQHQERLATGRRINRASDSPANYAITQKMVSKANSLRQAQENIGDAMAAMQEADTALARINDIMLDMKQLAQQASSDTVGDSERASIQYEIQQYAAEITDIAENTNWQGNQLLGGDLDWTLQVGEKSTDKIQFALSSSTEENKGFTAVDLGLGDLKASTSEEAAATWEALNAASEIVLKTEEVIGAVINRMDLKTEALNSAEVNTHAAISRIRDADIAMEQMSLAKENILQQIGLIMLGQAEQAPGAFLTLFR